LLQKHWKWFQCFFFRDEKKLVKAVLFVAATVFKNGVGKMASNVFGVLIADLISLFIILRLKRTISLFGFANG
jgi:hypothetical protein